MSEFLYDLLYMDRVSGKGNIPNNIHGFRISADRIKVSENTRKTIEGAMGEMLKIKSRAGNEIRFSNLVYDKVLVIDEENNGLTYGYVPVLKRRDGTVDINEHINRFRHFDINSLPLIEVARHLNITVEKRETLEPYGMFIPTENRIVMGSENASTFIHELVHAIDIMLGTYTNDKNFDEVVAEFTTIVICMSYGIETDFHASMYYIDGYFDKSNFRNDEFLERVWLIYECLQEIRKDIMSRSQVKA